MVTSIDLTFVWSRELRLVGTVAYGSCDDGEGKRTRTFDRTIDLAMGDEAILRPLVTHEFPLSRYREAFDVSLDRSLSKSVKALLLPQVVA